LSGPFVFLEGRMTLESVAPHHAHAGPEIGWITSYEGFLGLEREWDELARHEATPFLTHGWLRCWWEAFGAGDVRVCTVRREGRLVAALPLWRRGRVLAGWSNVETDEFVPLAETDADLEAVVDAVMAEPWGRLMLRGLPEEHRATAVLLERARRTSLTHSDPFDASPIIDTVGTLEEYRSSMSRNMRQRVGKHRRRLEREHDVGITVLETPEDPLAVLDEALALEHAGWKGAGGTAVLSSALRTGFYRSVTSVFAEERTFVVSELRVDGRLAAFDLALLGGGRVYSLITSYDESLGSYSPGLVLRMALVEACFERGLEANCLLGALLDWKTKFATRTRPTLTVRLYRRRPLPLARYLLRAAVVPRLRPLQARVRRRGAPAAAAASAG
jgi:CelD/BcsL family acetyltransferase involved in cellulose biosynthesis